MGQEIPILHDPYAVLKSVHFQIAYLYICMVDYILYTVATYILCSAMKTSRLYTYMHGKIGDHLFTSVDIKAISFSLNNFLW